MSDTSLWHSLFSRPSHSIEAIDWFHFVFLFLLLIDLYRCESNNAVTALVKEFWNTISNLMFVIVGLLICRQSKHLGLSWKFSGTGICVLLTGIASAYFHATLTLHGQRADEIFENLILVFLFRLDDNHGLRLWVHAFAASFGILFVSAVLFCELHLIVMALLNTFRLYKLQLPMSGVDSKKKFFSRNVVLAALLAIFGFVCWLIDRCAPNIFFHFFLKKMNELTLRKREES